MIKKVAGRYMSGKESNFTDSTLHLEGRELVVLDGTGTEIQRANFNEVKISTRIGTVLADSISLIAPALKLMKMNNRSTDPIKRKVNQSDSQAGGKASFYCSGISNHSRNLLGGTFVGLPFWQKLLLKNYLMVCSTKPLKVL